MSVLRCRSYLINDDFYLVRRANTPYEIIRSRRKSTLNKIAIHYANRTRIARSSLEIASGG